MVTSILNKTEINLESYPFITASLNEEDPTPLFSEGLLNCLSYAKENKALGFQRKAQISFGLALITGGVGMFCPIFWVFSLFFAVASFSFYMESVIEKKEQLEKEAFFLLSQGVFEDYL